VSSVYCGTVLRHPAALAQAAKGKSVPAFGSTHGSRIHHLDRSDLCWRLVSMPRDEPGFVVARGELDERGTQLFDRIEGLPPQQVFLQGSYEAFGYAVALGFTH